MERTSVPPSRILLIPIGFIIWSVAFVVLYATNAIGCAFGWDQSMQRGVLIAITAGFLALSAGAGWRIHRYWRDRAEAEGEPAPSLSTIGLYGSLSAFVALIGTFIPGLAASLCI